MNAQEITQRLYESFASDDLCEHPEIVDDVEELADEYEGLKAENAKLRELVRIMHGELVACEDNRYVCGGHKFDDRVRELGIEVKQ